jgi:hypothetical protein
VIAEVRIAAAAEGWEKAGFRIDDGGTRVGHVRLSFEEGDGGITGWSLAGAGSTDIDGLPTRLAAPEQLVERHASHPNDARRIDHLVVFTPELKRTVTALEGAGIDLRRVREPDEPGPPVRQAFFRLGEVILEVVENPRMEPGPARFWGLTLAVGDLDGCAALLGERLGEVHDAVQPGRRIATLRREAGLGLPVALISDS